VAVTPQGGTAWGELSSSTLRDRAVRAAWRFVDPGVHATAGMLRAPVRTAERDDVTAVEALDAATAAASATSAAGWGRSASARPSC
jgi:hypothetical protein